MKKNIKILFTYLFLCCISRAWLCSWYEQMWFLQYQEWADWISFNCQNQCVIALWQKDKIDYFNVDWMANWNGIIGYWFAIWNEISLLNQYNIVVSSQIKDSMNFMEYKQYFNSIPWDTELILVVDGNVNGNIKIDVGKFLFGQRIVQIWKEFWKMETFTPYSINLRYWASIMWTSIIKYGYLLFLLISILILIFKKWKKEQKYRIIFYVWLWLFLFIWVRNVVTYTSILSQWLNWFNMENNTYFDLWDYIAFTDKIRNELSLDSKETSKTNCKIYIDSFQDRPFLVHRENFYLKPCQRVLTWNLADYKIYYKTRIPAEDLDKTVLINFNNSYLLKNNSK